MARPLNKLDHVICRMDRQGMLGKTRSWRDVGGHFAHMIELPIRALSEQRDHHVLQSDHTHAQIAYVDTPGVQLGRPGYLENFVFADNVRTLTW